MSLQPATAPIRATPPPPAPRIPRRIIALRLPWWPTERLVRRCPEARTHPFVTAGESRNRPVITAANPRAIRAGLTPGMPLADGRAIVPGVVVRSADPAADALALERLARWADRFTPRVMPDGVDTIYLDIAGCARLFAGEEALMASLRTALEDFGLTVRLALADTPGAAWALAHYGADDPAAVPSGAGPSGLMDALAELPVAALRLSDKVADGLVSFGLDRIRTLSVMESVKLIRRFGVEPVRRLQQALGQVDEPIIPLRPLPPREAHRAFAEPISTPSDIHAAVDGLLDDLCLELSRAGEGARRLHLVCHRVDGDRRSLTIGTSRPLRRKEPLMGLFAEKLEQVEPGFGIDEITLATDVVETIDEVQGEWGGGGAVRYRGADEADRVAMSSAGYRGAGGDDRAAMSAAGYRVAGEVDRAATSPAGYRGAGGEELADLLDRLGNRFGFGRIGRPVPRQSWLPERAAGREPPLSGGNGGDARGDRNGGRSSGVSHGLSPGALPVCAADWPVERRRPLRLITPPVPVEIVTAEPGGPSPDRGDTPGPTESGDICHGLRGFRRQGTGRTSCMRSRGRSGWSVNGGVKTLRIVITTWSRMRRGVGIGCFGWVGGGSETASTLEDAPHPEETSRWFLHGLFA